MPFDYLSIRIPFYYFFKTVFLLYLSLPQTRGSSYLYINHLQPFFHTHEAQIDAALASFKVRVYTFLQERIRLLWEHVASTVGQQPNFAPSGGASNTGPPPRLGDPISGPATLMGSLWNSYGPGIVAGGAALLRQGAATTSGAAAAATAAAFIAPAASPPAPARQDTSERRRQLEAELASLAASPGPTPGGVPMPAYNFSSRNSSDADLRGRTGGMKFEEIEVPSDVEGYDVGSGSGGEGSGRPDAATRGSSWFGWGSAGKEGGDKVKSD